jgi:MFS family permease
MSGSTISKTQRNVMAASFGGWAGDAFDYQLFSLAVPLMLAAWSMTPVMAGSVATASLVAAAVGGMAGGALSDRFGRLRVLQASIAVVALSSLACAFVTEPWQLLSLRSVQGLGFGAEWSVGAVLLAEVSPDDRRGRFLGFMQSAWAFGWAAAVAVYLLVTLLAPSQLAWRLMFAAGVLPAAIVLWIRRSIVSVEVSNTPSIVDDAPADTTIGRKLVLTAFVGLAAHGGYHSLLTWLPTLLRVSRNYSTLQTGIVLLAMTAGFAAGCILAGRLADRLGRKTVIAAFAAGSVVAAGLFAWGSAEHLATLALAPAVGFAAGGVPAVLGAWFSELFPRPIRGASVGFAYNAGRMASAILPGAIGWGTQFAPLALLVGGAAALSYGLILILLPFLPETRGSTNSGKFQ